MPNPAVGLAHFATTRAAGAVRTGTAVVAAAVVAPGRKNVNRRNLEFPQGRAMGLAMLDPAVNSFTSFAKVRKYGNNRHAGMIEGVRPNTNEMTGLRDTWRAHRNDSTTLTVARAMISEELRQLAAAGVPVEDLDSAMLPALRTLGGAAVFGFGGAAPAAATAAGAAAEAGPAPLGAVAAGTDAAAATTAAMQQLLDNLKNNPVLAAQLMGGGGNSASGN